MGDPSLHFQSFYNAFLLLYKKFKEKDNAGNCDVLYFFPCVVNGALASELALKSILYHKKIPYEKNHDLRELFKLLPAEYQKEIVYRILQLNPKYNMDNFEKDFSFFAQAFIDFRYSYEGIPQLSMHGTFEFIQAIGMTHMAHFPVVIKTEKAAEQTLEEKRRAEKVRDELYEKILVKRRKREKRREQS